MSSRPPHSPIADPADDLRIGPEWKDRGTEQTCRESLRFDTSSCRLDARRRSQFHRPRTATPRLARARGWRRRRSPRAPRRRAGRRWTKDDAMKLPERVSRGHGSTLSLRAFQRLLDLRLPAVRQSRRIVRVAAGARHPRPRAVVVRPALLGMRFAASLHRKDRPAPVSLHQPPDHKSYTVNGVAHVQAGRPASRHYDGRCEPAHPPAYGALPDDRRRHSRSHGDGYLEAQLQADARTPIRTRRRRGRWTPSRRLRNRWAESGQNSPMEV